MLPCAVWRHNVVVMLGVHNSPRYSKRATYYWGASIVAVALLIIMGCVVQAIGETRVTEVSVEIGKHISLLSNRALGPVLHSLIQMRVPHMGLAKIDPHYLCLTDTHAHTVSILLSFTAACIFCAFFLSSFSFPPTTVMQKLRNLPNLSVFWTLIGSRGSSPWAGNCAHYI